MKVIANMEFYTKAHCPSCWSSDIYWRTPPAKWICESCHAEFKTRAELTDLDQILMRLCKFLFGVGKKTFK